MAERAEIQDILLLLKACLMLERYSVMDRQKNRQALISMGLRTEERREALLSLETEDYVGGPKPDDTDGTKEVWEFGKNVHGTDVYIKFRIVEDPKNKRLHWAGIWSFHEAEYSLEYTLKGGDV